jgi:POT family proton-dependent oligopeptide transporter
MAAMRHVFAAHPPGLSSLFFAELWERFSYYGMRALLTLFMVTPLAAGGLGFSKPEASVLYGNYTMAVYLLAIPEGSSPTAFWARGGRSSGAGW